MERRRIDCGEGFVDTVREYQDVEEALALGIESEEDCAGRV